jgi:hypothetical protein
MMQPPKPLPEPEQERAHATQHPLIEGFLTFMTWKFGDGFWDVTLNISDEAPKDGKSDSGLLPGLVDQGLYLEADLQVSATVPTDMFLPGYPYLWLEELRAVLKMMEGGAAYADLLSSMKVRHNIPLYVVRDPDDDDDDDDDEPGFEEPESPGGDEGEDGPSGPPSTPGDEKDEVSPCSMEIIIGFDQVVAAGRSSKTSKKSATPPEKKEDTGPGIS